MECQKSSHVWLNYDSRFTKISLPRIELANQHTSGYSENLFSGSASLKLKLQRFSGREILAKIRTFNFLRDVRLKVLNNSHVLNSRRAHNFEFNRIVLKIEVSVYVLRRYIQSTCKKELRE